MWESAAEDAATSWWKIHYFCRFSQEDLPTGFRNNGQPRVITTLKQLAVEEAGLAPVLWSQRLIVVQFPSLARFAKRSRNNIWMNFAFFKTHHFHPFPNPFPNIKHLLIPVVSVHCTSYKSSTGETPTSPQDAFAQLDQVEGMIPTVSTMPEADPWLCWIRFYRWTIGEITGFMTLMRYYRGNWWVL